MAIKLFRNYDLYIGREAFANNDFNEPENYMEKILESIKNAEMGIHAILFDQDFDREAFKITIVASTFSGEDNPVKPKPKQPRRRFDI